MIDRQRRREARPSQECRAGRGLLKQPVYIAAEDLPVRGQRTIGATIIQPQRRPLERHARAFAQVDLVAAHARLIEPEASTHVAQLLFPMQYGLQHQPTQTRALTRGALDAVRVDDLLAEHLKAAA